MICGALLVLLLSVKKKCNYEKGISNIGISDDFRRVCFFAQAAPVEVPGKSLNNLEVGSRKSI